MFRELIKSVAKSTVHHLGYPYNLQPRFDELQPLMRYSLNNLGDPFVQSNYKIDSRKYEKLTLEWFSRLWSFRGDHWGYVTSCGTEGNLHSLYMARENLYDPMLITSDQSHYSIFKACRMFRIPYVKVRTDLGGAMDMEDFRAEIRKRASKANIIVNVNIGSKVKGATDDIESVFAALEESGIPRDSYFVHCDSALFGMMLPFMDPIKSACMGKADSIVTSGHKFLGVPFPCGVMVTRKGRVKAIEQSIEYLNSTDTTMMGSRNGHAPLFMWHRIQNHGPAGFEKDVRKCVADAESLNSTLTARGTKSSLNVNSNIVYFEKPRNPAVIDKWQLACQGDIAHVVVMPNVDRSKLKLFVNDLLNDKV